MTSQEMMRTKLEKGYAFCNIAEIDEQPNWIIIKSPFGPWSDPNYGHGQIFGYDQDEFVKKQYK